MGIALGDQLRGGEKNIGQHQSAYQDSGWDCPADDAVPPAQLARPVKGHHGQQSPDQQAVGEALEASPGQLCAEKELRPEIQSEQGEVQHQKQEPGGEQTVGIARRRVPVGSPLMQQYQQGQTRQQQVEQVEDELGLCCAVRQMPEDGSHDTPIPLVQLSKVLSPLGKMNIRLATTLASTRWRNKLAGEC